MRVLRLVVTIGTLKHVRRHEMLPFLVPLHQNFVAVELPADVATHPRSVAVDSQVVQENLLGAEPSCTDLANEWSEFLVHPLLMRRHLAVHHEPLIADWTSVRPFLHRSVLSVRVGRELGLPKESLAADPAHKELLLFRTMRLPVQLQAVLRGEDFRALVAEMHGGIQVNLDVPKQFVTPIELYAAAKQVTVRVVFAAPMREEVGEILESRRTAVDALESHKGADCLIHVCFIGAGFPFSVVLL